MTYRLFNGIEVYARPGQLIRVSAVGTVLAVLNHRTNGLGMDFRAMPDGTLKRDIF
jgi:hypothetical protein